MTHTMTFTVTVELDRERGKFASRDDLGEAIRNELESCDPGQINGVGADGDSDYTVSSWTVDSAD